MLGGVEIDAVSIFSRVTTFWKVSDTRRSLDNNSIHLCEESRVALSSDLPRPGSAPVGIAIWKICYFQRERVLISVAKGWALKNPLNYPNPHHLHKINYCYC